MKRRRSAAVHSCAWVLLAVQVGIAAAQGSSHTDPAARGVPVTSIIEIGVVAASNYDVTITVLEVLRGMDAMARLQVVNAVAPPAAGHEYLLARIRFGLQGRAVSDRGAFDLGTSPFQWIAHSASLTPYDATALTPPQPALRGPVAAGESVEGWLAFAVEQRESEPILVFDPSSGGATGRGKILFFKLY